MKKVYFISGLGADKRVFSFLDLSFCEPVFISWISPMKKETLESYAGRLRKQIPETHPVVVGISFGGMLATEMAKTDPNVRAIIIASNKVKKEFPRTFRLGKYIPLYQLLPSALIRKIGLAYTKYSRTKALPQKKVLQQIIRDSDMRFLKWGIYAILHWKNNVIPEQLIHIHGTKDKLLPFRLVKADYTITGGTHTMPMDQHEEISALLKKLV